MASDKPRYEIMYFDGPGNGQLARFAMCVAGLDFTDTRNTWDEHVAAREAGKLPMGKVPVLIDHESGRTLGDSWAINRYVAQISGLYPTDGWVAAQAEMVVSTLHDIKSTAGAAWFAADREAAVEKWRTEKFPDLLGAVKKQYGERTWFEGDRPGYVDVTTYVMIRAAMRTSDKITKESLPEWKDLIDGIEALPAVKKYMDGLKAREEAKKAEEEAKAKAEAGASE